MSRIHDSVDPVVDDEVNNNQIDPIKPLIDDTDATDHDDRPPPSSRQSFEKREAQRVLDRWFGPIKAGSLRIGTFTLMSNMIGVGNLALPFTLRQSGLAMGVIMITLGALLGQWANKCLMYSAFKRNLSKYSDIVYAVLGKGAGTSFQLIFLWYMFGTMVNFQIVSNQLLQSFIEKQFDVEDSIFQKNGWYSTAMILGLNFLLYWIARAKDLTSLKKATVATVVILIYTTVLVLAESPRYFKSDTFSVDKIRYFNFNTSFLNAFAISAFSYFCQAVILPIKSELARPAPYRMKKVIHRSYIVIWILYVSLAVVGYLSLDAVAYHDFPDVIPKRPSLFQNDVLMNVAMILLAIGTQLGIAIRLNPTKLQLHILTGKPRNAFWNEFFTFILLGLSALLAIVYPKVVAVMSIIGGFGSTSISFLFPGLVYLKEKRLEKKRGCSYYGSILLTVSSVILGFGAGIMTILTNIGIVEKYDGS